MPVAALFDIHGNLPALEAVLEEVREAGVDQIVVGGDVVPGPMPAETLDCLRSLDLEVRFIRGNGEVAVLAARAGRASGYALPEQAQELVELSAGALSAEDVDFLSSWPRTIELSISGLGEVLFCHATPRDENEIFTRRTAQERVLPAFESVAASIVVCGHTHLPFDRGLGGLRILNAGSVGMPFGSPGAFWLLLGPSVEMRRTDYDVEELISRVRASGYPQVDWFAETLRRPQSEEEMLEIYERLELG